MDHYGKAEALNTGVSCLLIMVPWEGYCNIYDVIYPQLLRVKHQFMTFLGLILIHSNQHVIQNVMANFCFLPRQIKVIGDLQNFYSKENVNFAVNDKTLYKYLGIN